MHAMHRSAVSLPLAVISANQITRQGVSMHYRRICTYTGCKLLGLTVDTHLSHVKNPNCHIIPSFQIPTLYNRPACSLHPYFTHPHLPSTRYNVILRNPHSLTICSTRSLPSLPVANITFAYFQNHPITTCARSSGSIIWYFCHLPCCLRRKRGTEGMSIFKK